MTRTATKLLLIVFVAVISYEKKFCFDKLWLSSRAVCFAWTEFAFGCYSCALLNLITGWSLKIQWHCDKLVEERVQKQKKWSRCYRIFEHLYYCYNYAVLCDWCPFEYLEGAKCIQRYVFKNMKLWEGQYSLY